MPEMKIAVTADIHLSGGEEHIERYNALNSILNDLTEKKINTLVVAGDLFDKDCASYSRFEKICMNYPKISIHVIPGNHDPDISQSVIVGENIRIYDSPVLEEFAGLNIVFIPYSATSGMGECLENISMEKRWVLVGHGDYFGGLKQRNPYEKGTYMPLYRKDIEKYSPWKVFLGHIHKPMNTDSIYYPGSPCGIDINETGRRRYLVFSTETGRVTSETVQTDLIFFNEKFLIIPHENEIERLRNDAENVIAAWRLSAEDRKKARIRIKATGYTADREAIMACLKTVFKPYSFVQDEEPDISSLQIVRDNRRNAIAKRAIQLIEEMDWKFGGNEPDKEKVIENVLSVVYGGGG
ncbi:MAG: metallophosphoesterase [Candidatus Aegiribacteria sp.]|nr:metallophosphoesterase [Candidatus Aegiribacteria sp.]